MTPADWAGLAVSVTTLAGALGLQASAPEVLDGVADVEVVVLGDGDGLDPGGVAGVVRGVVDGVVGHCVLLNGSFGGTEKWRGAPARAMPPTPDRRGDGGSGRRGHGPRAGLAGRWLHARALGQATLASLPLRRSCGLLCRRLCPLPCHRRLGMLINNPVLVGGLLNQMLKVHPESDIILQD